MKHTPTPWKTDKALDRIYGGGKSGNLYIVAEAGRYFESKDDKKQAEANAAFIVRACNSHEALVEALSFIQDNLNLVLTQGQTRRAQAALTEIRDRLKILDTLE